MASEVEAFRYPVLEAERHQIRLLTVQKSDLESDLEGDLACHLEVVSLDDAVEFTALSYVWGTEQPLYSVQVDGDTLWIRLNLHAYLKLAADEETKGRGIFIDAICINQNDIAERSSQVALMGRVYSQADEVVVWFGMEERWTSWLLSKHPSTRDNDVLEACLLGEAPSCLSAENARHVETGLLVEISDNPNWSRLWTVQEYQLPHRLQLRANKLRISGSSFHAAVRRRFLQGEILERFGNMLRSTSNDKTAEDRNSDCSNTFVALRLLSIESTTEQKSIPLYRAVISFAGQDCFLMYDKIFGLLGLSDSSVIPDYSKTPLQIYAQVLIEGLREIAQGTNLDSEDNPTIAMPAVMLITLLAINRADLDLSHLILFLNMTLKLRQPRLYQFFGTNSDVLMALSYVEADSATRRVECMREHNSVIAGPDGLARTYAAWEQDVDQADKITRKTARQP
ncbi:hypothetical protein LTR10_007733 [Elasticomyces elasticus]|nr:hypothetical protein LTR10_007733 [Elasticomyces elasticus]KAK4970734.1 hypothetical protein LTR42_007710 [Elasticomyces elasticus]